MIMIMILTSTNIIGITSMVLSYITYNVLVKRGSVGLIAGTLSSGSMAWVRPRRDWFTSTC